MHSVPNATKMDVLLAQKGSMYSKPQIDLNSTPKMFAKHVMNGVRIAMLRKVAKRVKLGISYGMTSLMSGVISASNAEKLNIVENV